MAISTGSSGMNTLGTSIVNPMYTDNNIREVAIKGECFSVSKSFGLGMINDDVITPDEIKRMLIRDLLEKMLDSNFIEFTKLQDYEKITFRARVFVVPDSLVRLLRLEGVIE